MIREISVLSAVAILAGCVTQTPAPDPVLQASGQTACAPTVSLAAPAALTPPKPAGTFEKIVPIDATAPCRTVDTGGRQSYALFELPTLGKLASVSAGAVLEKKRVLAPTVLTLASDGRVLRTFAREELVHRGNTLSVLFAPKSDEKYIMVAVDASAIGAKYSYTSSASGLASKAPPPPGKMEPLPTGAPFSYEGQAFARVYFSNPAPASSAPAPSASKKPV